MEQSSEIGVLYFYSPNDLTSFFFVFFLVTLFPASDLASFVCDHFFAFAVCSVQFTLLISVIAS